MRADERGAGEEAFAGAVGAAVGLGAGGQAEGGSAAIEAAPTAADPGLSTFLGAEIVKSERPELTAARIVISGGRVLFLEVKSQTGRLRKSQEVFRDAVVTQGFGWALVRSVDEALGALADHGFTSRVQLPARRTAP